MSADSGHGGHGWFLTLHRWAVDRHEAMPLLAEHRAWVLKHVHELLGVDLHAREDVEA